MVFTGGAKVKLPGLVADNMVLQRQTEVSLWGWADAGKTVTVTTSWDGKNHTAKAAPDGAWIVKVATPEAGGPYKIKISDGQAVELSNVMIGEVWICSGQSNMEMPVKGFGGQPVDGSLKTILQAGQYRDRIRMFTVPRNSVKELQDDVLRNEDAVWKASTPDAAASVSATAYYFARNLTEALGVPVGIVVTSWGGSYIETWMDEKTATAVEGFDMATFQKPEKPWNNHDVSLLYNGMLWPVRNYTAKGFIWYQGESNRGAPKIYARQMAEMVGLWRQIWGNAQMPFYYVQIAPYSYGHKEKWDLGYLCEAQAEALKLIPLSGMAATADAGDEFCIHPPQKDVVGQRLALLALSKTYGQKGFPAHGPVYKDVEFKDGAAVVSFDYARTLSPQNRPLAGFDIAGEDKVFYPAEAVIVNGKAQVKVSAKEVPSPVAVRYCFRNYTDANLTDTFGVAAYPFRTDNW